MAFSLFSSKQIANIIIKDHVIRYIGVKNSTPLTVTDFRERYLPIGIIQEGRIIERDTLHLILDECITDWGLKKAEVRFIIPDSFVVIRKTSIPIEVKDDEINGYLYLELGSTIHLPFDEPIIDFNKLSEEEDKKEILMIAAPEEISRDYASLLEDVGLKPVAADISPLCLYRLFDFCNETLSENHTLLLQFDLQSLNLSIFHKHIPLFMRHLDLDTSVEDWDIQPNRTNSTSKLVWSNTQYEVDVIVDELLKEIEHVLNFYHFTVTHGKEQVTNIFISGDHPYLQVLVSMLEDRYELPVTTIGELEKLPASYFLPLGLALKEVQ
ncbi:type IV pilus biogenesis protein PilM [Fredinandcohnia onubensis]|uniref:type IV pilus biogenesis protein PilM n=1 Tax=Fredinandcohnia onubensis TaxID=1571209 RepID=UPI000C0BDE84|nr:pilus assembly protein PilM [Fredinandcohnia onubensis]